VILNGENRLNIETNLNTRWEKGIDHHSKSIEIMKALKLIDFNLCNDCFCWKTGGDGDNGETLMYQLDIFFEAQDNFADLDALIKKETI